MIEMYLRLYEAKTTSFLPRGSAHGIGREEILGAASIAKSRHPLGDRMVLAEMGDQHSIQELADWTKSILPSLCDEVVVVALGRPLPDQIKSLVNAHPRYMCARRQASILRSEANHLRNKGRNHDATNKELNAASIEQAAFEHCKAELFSTGRCPKCHGTGIMERKGDTCPVCQGSGKVVPTLKTIFKKHGEEVYNQFIHLVDVMQIDKNEWIRLFMKKIGEEIAA